MFLNKFRKKKIYQDGDSLVIEIPKKFKINEEIMLYVGIFFFALFAIFLLPSILNAYIIEMYKDIPIFFSILILFIVGFLLRDAIYVLFEVFIGKEIISLTAKDMIVSKTVIKNKIIQQYENQQIQNIGYNMEINFESYREVTITDINKRQGGNIIILCNDKFFKFGNNLNGIEAKEILLAMKISGYLNPEVFKPYNILED